MHTTLGSRLRLARDAKGLSQAELGEAVGAERNAVGNWETDVSIPAGRYIPKLLEVLGVDANWLFRGEYGGGVLLPPRAVLEDLRTWLDLVLPTSPASGNPSPEEMAASLLALGWTLIPPGKQGGGGGGAT